MEEFERISRHRLSDSDRQSGEKTRAERPRFRVCIIGAGLAGLSAAEAFTLQNNREDADVDIEVTVLEAMERPGGRASTLSFAGGLVEGGAQYIHGCEGNPVYHRAKQNKLKLSSCIRHSDPIRAQQRNGKRVPESFYSEVGKFYDNVLLKTQAPMYSEQRKVCGDRTVGAFMKRHFEKYYRIAPGNSRDKRIKANIFRMMTLSECCYSACNHLNDLMLQDFGEYKELIGNVQFAGGYQEFVETFLDNISPGTIIYSKPVQQIDWNKDKKEDESAKPLTVTCQDGADYSADYVIVTTSLGYLKEHAPSMFTPSLPTHKLDLIARMGFGTAGKIWLEYEKPFWADNWGGIYLIWDVDPKEVMTRPFKQKEWAKYIYGIVRLHSNPRVLMVWMSGEAAEHVETLDDDSIAHTLTGVLRQYLNNRTIPPPVGLLKSKWHSNPYVRGSYSYVAAGSSGADIDSLAEPVCIPCEKRPDKLAICFAGEATHRTFYSTTHGAMLSGQREAERIISDVRLRAKVESDASEDDDGRMRKENMVEDECKQNLNM